jgi:hypothetical protein
VQASPRAPIPAAGAVPPPASSRRSSAHRGWRAAATMPRRSSARPPRPRRGASSSSSRRRRRTPARRDRRRCAARGRPIPAGGADEQEDRHFVLPVARQFEEIATDDLPGEHAAGDPGGDPAQRRRRRVDAVEHRLRGAEHAARRDLSHRGGVARGIELRVRAHPSAQAAATARASLRNRAHSALRSAKSFHTSASAILRHRSMVAASMSCTLTPALV